MTDDTIAPLPPPHGGKRTVAMLLNRIDKLLPQASPHQVAQISFGLARLIAAVYPPAAAAEPGQADLDEGPTPTGLLPTDEQTDRLHALLQEIADTTAERDAK